MFKFKKKHYILLFITVVNLAVFCALGGYYLTKDAAGAPATGGGDTETPGGNDTPAFTYTLNREPVKSLSLGLSWSLTLGGTGNDTLKDVYDLGKYYLLGETASSDYDFGRDTMGNALFLMSLDKSGKVLSSLVFGGGQTYAGSVATEEGFYVLGNTESGNGDYSITRIGFDGNIVGEKAFGDIRKESAKKIISNGDYVIVAVEITHDIVSKTEAEVLFFDFGLNRVSLRKPSRPSSLSIVSLLPLGANSALLTVSAFDGLTCFTALYRMNPTSQYGEFDKLPSHSHTALDIIPWKSGGYLMLFKMNNNGQAMLMTVSSDIASSQNIDLKYQNVSGGRIIPHGSGYLLNLVTDGGALLLSTDGNINIISDPISGGGMETVASFYQTTNSTILTGTESGNISVKAIIGESVEYSASIGGSGIDYGITVAPSGTSMILFANTASKDKDISYYFGMQDIFVAKLVV